MVVGYQSQSRQDTPGPASFRLYSASPEGLPAHGETTMTRRRYILPVLMTVLAVACFGQAESLPKPQRIRLWSGHPHSVPGKRVSIRPEAPLIPAGRGTID